MTSVHSESARSLAVAEREQGLSRQEVMERRAHGEGNAVAPVTGRTYPAILRENVFTFINNVLFALCAALVVLGELSDAVVAAGVVLGNVIVSLVQEVRAKRTLDRIALLTRPRAVVIRDGQEQSVDPAEIVLGDVLAVRPGDQIIVDEPLVSDGGLEVDESLLTGEAEAVPKRSGDPLYSGSFCVAGSGLYRAEKVGTESFAHKLTSQARGFRRVLTPMQREVNVIVRVILLVAIIFELLLLAPPPAGSLLRRRPGAARPGVTDQSV